MHKSRARKPHNGHHQEFDLSADIEKIKNAFSETAEDVKEKTDEIFLESYDGLKEKTNELQKKFADFASEQPFKTLGAALLIGLAIGYFIKK